MDYSIFKLGFLQYLQDKYAQSFPTLAPKGVYVLLPILRGKKVVFPVAKRVRNNLSRFVGIIEVQGSSEKIIEFTDTDFTSDQDFSTFYSYLPFDKEGYKLALETLYKVCGKNGKHFLDEYYNILSAHFSAPLVRLYNDLITNTFFPLDTVTLNSRAKYEFMHKQKYNQETSRQMRETRRAVHDELVKFIKSNILPETITKSGLVKLKFFDELGRYLRNLPDFEGTTSATTQTQVGATIAYAKALNDMPPMSSIADYLSKLVIMVLNAIMIEEKQQKIISKFEEEITECVNAFYQDIDKVTDERTKKELTNYMQMLQKDYTISTRAEMSNLMFGYLYIFVFKN